MNMFKVNIKALLIIVVALSIVISYHHRENFIERFTPSTNTINALSVLVAAANNDIKLERKKDGEGGGGGARSTKSRSSVRSQDNS